MDEKLDMMKLCDLIRQVAFDLHRFLKHGHLEKVYENGLLHRLQKEGVSVEAQYPLKVLDEDGAELGDYYADLFVEDCLVIELKACKALAPEHLAQLFGYLRASGQKHGLLINFGAPKLEIRKIVI